MKKQTGSRNRGWLPMIRNRLSVAAGVALAAGMLAGTAYGEVRATGGHVLLYAENGSNFVAHVFLSNGTFTVTNPGDVEYLVVAGGGSGAIHSVLSNAA